MDVIYSSYHLKPSNQGISEAPDIQFIATLVRNEYFWECQKTKKLDEKVHGTLIVQTKTKSWHFPPKIMAMENAAFGHFQHSQNFIFMLIR